MADPHAGPPRTPRGNTHVGSNGSTSSSSQRRRGGRGAGRTPSGTFWGSRQVYKPKAQSIESQNVEYGNSKFEIGDTSSGDCGERLSLGGLTQSIESQNVQNVNRFVSKFETEDSGSGYSGERLSLDGVSIGFGSHSEEKCGGDKEKKEDSEGVLGCFDICVRKEGSGVLKPSFFQMNKEQRKQMKRFNEGQKVSVLRHGMVLLKNYLSIIDQVKIVNRCRELGLGAGGFYQPGYRDGGRLNLKMMCLGKHWDPETSMYGEYRPSDNAKPPVIPREFRELVEKSIKDAHSHIERIKGSNVKEILPLMSPNICIVNFYSSTGRLGLHQDKDESEESILKGLPVVSFSIGESAEFLYGDHRDVDRAEKVALESGDVLIFGGKSRQIFHGVSSVLKETAPSTLLGETSLRPGRLNLTFRQY